MPPRNNPAPNAMRLFNCAICDKGYPRQIEYENHLRSYDHTHRQRLADMKKLTASNDTESSKPKAGPEMRAINIANAGNLGPRFTKIAGGVDKAGAGSRFKKVGVAVGAAAVQENNKKDNIAHVPGHSVEQEAGTAAVTEPLDSKKEEPAAAKKSEAKDNEQESDEEITWEEYDFTKPTGCDHKNCQGCQTGGIWGPGWVKPKVAAPEGA